MTREQQVVLRTLNQIQEETDKFIQERRKQIKNNDSVKDAVINLQIDMLCLFDLIVGRVAQKNGIEIEVKVREDL